MPRTPSSGGGTSNITMSAAWSASTPSRSPACTALGPVLDQRPDLLLVVGHGCRPSRLVACVGRARPTPWWTGAGGQTHRRPLIGGRRPGAAVRLVGAPGRTRPTRRSRRVPPAAAARTGSGAAVVGTRPARRRRRPPGRRPREKGSHHSSKVANRTVDGQRRGLDVGSGRRRRRARPGDPRGPRRARTRRATLGVDVAHRLPERRERPAAAGVVPHAGRDDAARAGDPRHLAGTRRPGRT